MFLHSAFLFIFAIHLKTFNKMKKAQEKVKLRTLPQAIAELVEMEHQKNIAERELKEALTGNEELHKALEVKKSVIVGLNALIAELEKRCIVKDKKIGEMLQNQVEREFREFNQQSQCCNNRIGFVGLDTHTPTRPKDQINTILGTLDISEAVFVLEQVTHHTRQHVIELRTEANNEKSLFDGLAEKLSKL